MQVQIVGPEWFATGHTWLIVEWEDGPTCYALDHFAARVGIAAYSSSSSRATESSASATRASSAPD